MRLGRIFAGLVALAVLGVTPVVADPVEIGTGYETYYRSRGACADWYSEYSESTYKYVYFCGENRDSDDDGVFDVSYVWGSRYDCVWNESDYDCQSHSLGGEVPLDDVVIDLDAGLATVTTTVGSCAIDLEYVAGQQTYDYSYEGPALVPFPGIGEDGVHLYDRYRDSERAFDATAQGTVCDWPEVASPSEWGRMGEAHYEDGYTYVKVNPYEITD